MAHINYYLDLCTDTYIVNGDAVLLRLHDKYHFWGAPGGHIDPDEDANQAALREVWEETGLKVVLVGPADWSKKDEAGNVDLVPPVFVNRHHITDTHEHSAFIFVAVAASRTLEPQIDEDKNAEFKWCTKSELDELLGSDERMHSDTHRYATMALRLAAKRS